MQLDPTQLDEDRIYRLMVSSILPRPIAWISTVDREGRTNLAPFSYFMGVCCKPMTVLFCPVVGTLERPKKDTLLNVEAVPEFVVNVAQEHTISAVNLTAAPFADDESEFERAGVTPAASSLVRPPRVQEAGIAFECAVREIIEVSDQPGGGSVVLGTVLCVHVDVGVIDQETLRVDREALAPVARLGGQDFLRASDAFSLKRHTSVPATTRSTVVAKDPSALGEFQVELLNWVRANAQAGAPDVGLDTPLFSEDAVLDSVASVSLVLLVEEKFGCTVDLDTMLEGDAPTTVRTVVKACAQLPTVASATV